MKKTLEVVALTIAMFVLASESDDLMTFIVSHLVALAVFAFCAFDLNMLNVKKR